MSEESVRRKLKHDLQLQRAKGEIARFTFMRIQGHAFSYDTPHCSHVIVL